MRVAPVTYWNDMNQRRPLTVCNFGQIWLEDLVISINYDTMRTTFTEI